MKLRYYLIPMHKAAAWQVVDGKISVAPMYNLCGRNMNVSDNQADIAYFANNERRDEVSVENTSGMITPIIKFYGNGNLHEFCMYPFRDIGNNEHQAREYVKDFMKCLRREIKSRKKRK